MKQNISIHLFLTGYSLKLIKDRSIINENDIVITTNLGILDDFISSKCNYYYLSTSHNLIYRKNTYLCLKNAELNLNGDCKIMINKKYFNFIKNMNKNRDLIPNKIKNTWLKRFNKEKAYQATNQYCGFKLISDLNYKNVFLWGADYILSPSIDGHFYNRIFFKSETNHKFTTDSYRYILNTFNNLNITQVCPIGYKSIIFNYINLI